MSDENEKDEIRRLGDLISKLPSGMKSQIANDLSDKILDSLTGFPVDIVLLVSINLVTNAMAAAVVSEDEIDVLIDKTAEQLRTQVRRLYPEYDHIGDEDASKNS